MSATGFAARHCPQGPELDRLLHVARIGERFAGPHRARGAGFLRAYVAGLVAETRPASFAAFLVELRLLARLRRGPIIEVDRESEIVTYLDPRHGEREVRFKTIQNLAHIRKQNE